MGSLSIASLLWVVYFGAAYWLVVRRQGNAAIVAGLVGLGVVNLLFAAPAWVPEMGDLVDEYYGVLGYASPVAVVVLVLGLLGLAARAAGRSASEPGVQKPGPGDLTSLLVPRTESNTFVRAEALRDEIAARLAALASAAGVRTIEQKSNAHSAEVWLVVHYLLPTPASGLSLRASVEVQLQRHDFHRFEHLFDVTARVGSVVRTVTGVIAIDDEAAARIHRFVTVPGARLRLPRCARRWPWQLWRPRNKLAKVGRDWPSIGSAALGVGLLVIPVLGPLLGAGVFVWRYFHFRKRPTYTLTGGKPPTDPRSLHWLDSWQATVAGLSGALERFREGTTARLRSGAPAGLDVRIERFSHWSVDGPVERDQLAVRYRRALGFIHAVPYGEHLYVGWECHLNSAAWAEETLARGIDRASGCAVHANRLVYGVQGLNEHDLADANFLSEWMHDAVKRELQLQAAERKIDLEVDFTVQRESRQEAIGGAADAAKKKPARAGLLAGRFKRVN